MHDPCDTCDFATSHPLQWRLSQMSQVSQEVTGKFARRLDAAFNKVRQFHGSK